MEEMILKTRALKTGYRGKNFETPVVAYFAVMFRQRDLDDFGHLSIDYGRGMFEDDDHCKVIRTRGFICAVAEDAFVHHHLSATFSKIDDAERKKLFDDNKAIFESKWGPWKPHEYRDNRLKPDLQFPNEELFKWKLRETLSAKYNSLNCLRFNQSNRNYSYSVHECYIEIRCATVRLYLVS